MTASARSTVVRHAGVCSGRAHVDGTRIPVWILIAHQRSGLSTRELLSNYPALTSETLDAAWEYYRQHPIEIERDIWSQDIAGNVLPDQPVPTQVIIEGIRLGLDDDELRNSFEPALSDERVAAAWREFRSLKTEPAPLARAG